MNPVSSDIQRYTRVASALHWLMALAIFAQLAGGLWMVDAIKQAETKQLAYQAYQWHKAVGLILLTLAILRLIWRFTHRPPPLPLAMKPIEKRLAHAAHIILYGLMILIPLLGWAMVSTSPYGLPTIIFGWFEWPHLPFLVEISDKAALSEWFEESHELLAKLMILMLVGHILAALKHQLISKDQLLSRLRPW